MENEPEAFRTYLDESEESVAGIYAVGGFVGKSETWDELQPKWRECLPTSVSFFHTTDCITGNKEFKGVDFNSCLTLLDRLTDLVISREVRLVGYGIDVPTYQQLAPKARQNDFLGNKYAAPFGGVVELACLAMGNSPDPEDIWNILENGENWEQSAFFVESNEYSASAMRTIASMRQSRELWFRSRISKALYGSKFGSNAIPMPQVGDRGLN